MKKTKFILLLLVVQLQNEAVVQGKTGTQNTKSFASKMSAIEKQLQSLQDQLLNRPLQGRKKLDLLASLEEDYVISTQNENLRKLAEMVSSLEEDYYQSANGALNIRSFRQSVKSVKSTLLQLKQSYGVAKKRSVKPRRTFTAVMVVKPSAPVV